MTEYKICKYSKPDDKIGKPEEIAKAVHYYLDWVRAVKKRRDDNRGFNVEELLEKIQAGHPIEGQGWGIHFTGD